MYKLRKGVILPKEFKIKVNADESKALQEYLFSVGYSWFVSGKTVKRTDKRYLFINKKDRGITFSENSDIFKSETTIEIQFNDYFYLDFPEKFCIEVTEENYKELDVWMHRNWKNYVDYHDKWCIEKPTDDRVYYFVSENKEGGGHSFLGNYKNYTLITTDQFRGKFGNLKVHDVEIISNYVEGMAKDFDNSIVQKMGETKAQGTEQGEKDYYGINTDIVEAFNVINNEKGKIEHNGLFAQDFIMKIINNCDYVFSDGSKMKLSELIKINDYYQDRSNYHKEKSDRLMKEKFEMSKRFEKVIDSKNNEIISKDLEIQFGRKQLEVFTESFFKFKKKIKKLKNKVKWLSLR